MSVMNGLFPDTYGGLEQRWLIQVFVAIYLEIIAIGVIVLVHLDPGLQYTVLLRAGMAVQLGVCALLKYGPIKAFLTGHPAFVDEPYVDDDF